MRYLQLLWLAIVEAGRNILTNSRRTPEGALFTAIATENPILTWRRVQQQAESIMTAGAMNAFLAIKSWVIQNKGELKLQLLPIANPTGDVVGATGGMRVYAVYLKKQNTATAAFWKLFDNATSTGTAADERITVPLKEANKEVLHFFPDGLPLTAGAVFTSHTTSNGTTGSTTGDGPNGFMLVGAA